MKRILPTLLLTTTLAAGVAAPAMAADKLGVREVCAKSTYVKHEPGKTVIGTLFKHQKIKVERYHGKYAYGFAKGHANKHGWVLKADLCS
jgi:hypothetical protein